MVTCFQCFSSLLQAFECRHIEGSCFLRGQEAAAAAWRSSVLVQSPSAVLIHLGDLGEMIVLGGLVGI